ncbi:MAG TPA: S8 family serine peptidase [Azospirillum sp.]
MADRIDFKDRGDFRRWLEDKPIAWARVIAVRAALRVLPLTGNAGSQRKRDGKANERLLLMVFRAGFISYAAGKFPAYAKGYSAAAATAAAACADTFAAAAFAAFAAFAAAASAAAAAATDAAVAAADAAAAATPRPEAIWKAVSRDAERLMASVGNSEDGRARELIRQPLWLDKLRRNPRREANLPPWAREAWDQFVESALAKEGGFAPWIAWYEALLSEQDAAQPRDYFGEALTIRIATQLNAWWERGAVAVNGDIARWLEEASAGAAPSVPEGVSAVAVPSSSRIFVRLPDTLARDFNPAALRAPSPEAFQRVLALGPGALLPSFEGVAADTGRGRMLTGDTLVVGNAGIAAFLKEKGATLYRDVQFQFCADGAGPWEPEHRYWDPIATAQPVGPGGPDGGSLDDVLRHINAREAWALSEGDGATIAVIDTGIHPDLREFGHNRRHSLNPDSVHRDRHWVDHDGHGSMCAVIAAGGGGEGPFSGVAPEAGVISCRTDFTASDIADIYANLIDARRTGQVGGPLIVNNSYGLYSCQSSGEMPDDHPYMDVIRLAIDEGIVVVFAAGNNHHDVKCNHPPDADGPNTIWGPNSHDRVLSVGTVNRDNSNQDRATPHVNSSRGPGEWAVTHPKPDCVAPTYGAVTWGNGRRVMPWWGTSGAAPQVSGLAALIQSFAVRTNGRAFRPGDVNDIIRESCRPLAAPATCVGRGLIDCGAALRAARKRLEGGRTV